MTAENKTFTLALAGNPNCGKTTLFNALTGSKQYVGNWPGVTVEKKSGFFSIKDQEIELTDLPGIYSLTTYSIDEKITRNYLLDNKPDLIVNIIDASNLERNLYLTIQLLQMGVPVIIALNMMDIVDKMGLKIDISKLEKHLNSKVIPISASKKEGLDNLKQEISDLINHPEPKPSILIPFDEILENSIQKVVTGLNNQKIKKIPETLWFALKLLEKDEQYFELADEQLKVLIEKEREKIFRHTRMQAELVIADGIYGFIHGLLREIIRKKKEDTVKLSDKIDSVVLNPILGLPVFMGVMYILFSFSITLSQPFIGLFDSIFGGIFVDKFSELLHALHLQEWMILLLADGIGGGIQTVSTFIPPIFFIFLLLSLLEDSGYMARAAFVMDRFMRLLGLSGKSIIPMIVGFGCTVPAVMAARTLENKRDRLMTILLVPFIQCGAKIPVYSMFATLFFGAYAGKVIFSLYFIGIIFALISGLLFRKFIFDGKTSDFVMELPSYHIPTLNGIFMHTWFKLKGFILRAGQTILLVIIVLTMINSLKIGYDQEMKKDETLLTLTGKSITPLFAPMGIEKDNWGATVALFTGLFAKEAIIGTLEAVHLPQQNEVKEKVNLLQLGISSLTVFWDDFQVAMIKILNPFKSEESEPVTSDQPLAKAFKNIHQVIAYLLFIVIYAPCAAAISTVNKEAGFKTALFQVIYLTLMAWAAGVVYYQIAQFNQMSLLYLLISAGVMMGLIVYMKKIKLYKED